MNILAAPLLHSMPEFDAFLVYNKLLTRYCPRYYVEPAISGAKDGAALVEKCSRHDSAETLRASCEDMLPNVASPTSLPHVISLSSSRRMPMTQILRLWDVLFSCGIYVNILFIVACIIAMEDQIMRSESAAAIQALLNEGKGAPSFESREIITAAVSYVSMIPDELLSILRLHPTDEVVIPQVVVEVSQGKYCHSNIPPVSGGSSRG